MQALYNMELDEVRVALSVVFALVQHTGGIPTSSGRAGGYRNMSNPKASTVIWPTTAIGMLALFLMLWLWLSAWIGPMLITLGAGLFLLGDQLVNRRGRIAIRIGVFFILAGGVLGTLGWHQGTQDLGRADMVASLSDACRTNYQTLSNLLASESMDDWQPVETSILSAALASGLFVGQRHNDLRGQLRKTTRHLDEYSYALSNKYVPPPMGAGPHVFLDLAVAARVEVEHLASLLEQVYGERVLDDEQP